MASAMDNWIDLIGKPFRYGGRGPDHYDCYGLIMEMNRRNGVEIPDCVSPTNHQEIALLLSDQKRLWKEVSSPKVGDVVCIRIGRFVSHVGYLVSPSSMLHAWESTGVLVEPLSVWSKRIDSYFRYEHA